MAENPPAPAGRQATRHASFVPEGAGVAVSTPFDAEWLEYDDDVRATTSFRRGEGRAVDGATPVNDPLQTFKITQPSNTPSIPDSEALVRTVREELANLARDEGYSEKQIAENVWPSLAALDALASELDAAVKRAEEAERERDEALKVPAIVFVHFAVLANQIASLEEQLEAADAVIEAALAFAGRPHENKLAVLRTALREIADALIQPTTHEVMEHARTALAEIEVALKLNIGDENK